MREVPFSIRIELLIKELGYNASSFSRAIGINNNVTINRILKGASQPSNKVLSKITTRFKCINADWILTDIGEPFLVDIKKKKCQVNCTEDCQVTHKKGNPNQKIQTTHGKLVK